VTTTAQAWPLALLVLGCALGTYVWRGIGVWIADRIDVESELFHWLKCIAYAMIAGLIARVVLLPVGELAQTTLVHRLIGVAVALVAFRIAGRSQLAGVLLGAASLPLLGLAR
jgi:branched-subunit amino acid transport protein